MFKRATRRELAEMRRASGVFSPQKDVVGSYKPNETTLNGTYMGANMFGPKVGDFLLNATGVDPNAITVDTWNHHTWDRLTGQLQSFRGKAEREAGITSDTPRPGERNAIERMKQELAAEKGYEPSGVQALLWYYEQELYRDHGIYSPSQSFSDGARAFLEKRPDLNAERTEQAGSRVAEGSVRDAEARLAQARTGEGPGGQAEGRRELNQLNQPQARGSIQLPSGGVLSGDPILIRMGETADVSTFIHEGAHFWLEQYHELYQEAQGDGRP